MIDEYLASEYGEQTDDYYQRTVGEYHSSATGNCVRRNFLDWIEDTRPGKSAWPHFELGNNIEDIVEDALINKHDARHVKNSIPIEIQFDEFRIVGETDLVVLGKNLTLDTLYEIKSTGNLKYTKDEPKMQHLYQIHCYMHALGAETAKIVYVDKFRLDTVEHTVEYDEEIWDDIVDRTERLHTALITGEPPEPHEDSELWDHFCDHESSGKCCKEQ